AGQVALGALLGVGRGGHVDGEQVLLRVLADRGDVDPTYVGVGPADGGGLVLRLGLWVLGAVVGGLEGDVEAAAGRRQDAFQRVAAGVRLLAEPAGDGEGEQLLHQRRVAGRRGPGVPVHVGGRGQQDDPAAVARRAARGALARRRGGQRRLPLDQGRVAD